MKAAPREIREMGRRGRAVQEGAALPEVRRGQGSTCPEEPWAPSPAPSSSPEPATAVGLAARSRHQHSAPAKGQGPLSTRKPLPSPSAALPRHFPGPPWMPEVLSHSGGLPSTLRLELPPWTPILLHSSVSPCAQFLLVLLSDLRPQGSSQINGPRFTEILSWTLEPLHRNSKTEIRL